MSSRARAAGFAAGALVCAALSAALAGSSAGTGSEELGELRQVVVTSTALERGEVIGRRELKGLEERRVPVAFAPPDALGLPEEALGRKLGASIPAGSYLNANLFASGGGRAGPLADGPPRGTTPVEIEVTGAGALAASRTGSGEPVDVVVSGESTPGPNAGRTYVAAEGVPLLALREAREEPGLGSDRWVATLALTRGQALELIRAEGIAASIRLLAG